MIGNDIVDLQLAAESKRWLSLRLWEKVFTSDEQDQIRSSQDPHSVIWRLWSMKESAYKAYVRKCAKTFLDPLRMKCKIYSKVVPIVI